jgi:hypothetical protein
MIEDLIEGIACYCDNDYQVNALNNMYSTLYPNQRSFGFFGNLANAIKGKYNEAKKSYYDRHDKDKMIRNLKYERDQAIYDRKIDSDIHANVIKDANDTIGTLYHNDQSDLKGFNKVKNAAKRYKAEAEKNAGAVTENGNLKKSMHNWKVGAAVGGGLAGVAALGLGAYALYKHNKKKKLEAEKAAELASKI